MKRFELETEIFLLLDGELGGERLQALDDLLFSDAAAREVYRECVRLHSALEVRMKGGNLVEAWNVVPIARIVEMQRRKWLKLSVAAAVAMLLAIGGLLWDRHGIIREADEYAFQVTPGSDFSVTHEASGKTSEGQVLRKGSRLELRTGFAECMLEDGVRALLEAPCDLIVLEKGSVRLAEGEAWFHVPPAGTGFTVTTDELEIIDLGTEFGVVSSPSRNDEIHVFRGKVLARSLNPVAESRTLTAGQASSTDAAGRMKDLSPERSRFLKSLPVALGQLHFGFDSQTDGRLTVTGGKEITARIISDNPAATLVPGVVGNALSLNGKNEWIETDWPGISGNLPRSVAFWMKIPKGAMPGGSQPAIVGWGDDNDRINSKWKIWATRMHQKHLHLRVSFGAQNFDNPTRLDDGKWHHYAVSYEGGTLPGEWPKMRAWIDGKTIPLTESTLNGSSRQPPEINTDTAGDNSSPLRIGFGLRKNLPLFRGELDELHIFRSQISDTTVKDLHGKKFSENKPLNKK